MKKGLLSLALYAGLLGGGYLQAQTITTIAGNGIQGYSGDGGPATLGQMGYPRHVATDNTGNVYVADLANYCVRKIDIVSGIITTIAGNNMGGYSGDGGPATLAGMHPFSLATDGAGNLYIADVLSRVRKVNTAGIISTIAGNGANLYSGDGVPATSTGIDPKDIVLDGSGNIYIADGFNNRVRKIDPSGIISTIAGTGASGYSGDGFPATDAQLNGPSGVAVDGSGNIYIADQGNHRIRKVDAAGITTTIGGNGVMGIGGEGIPATLAELNRPFRVNVDANDNVYVGHTGERRVRRIGATGIIRTFAGTGASGYSGDGGMAKYAKLYGMAVAFDGPGKVYIADYNNSAIRLVTDDTVKFAGGALRSVVMCGTEYHNIDTALAVNDADTGQALHWSLVSPPAHGTALVAYSDTATGFIVTPTGLAYTPAVGYVGADTFQVRVYDEMLADTIMICVTVYPANPGTVAGPDTVCVGHTIALTDSVPGGTWSASNGNVTVSSTGIVTGIAAGAVAVSYTISNPCITASALHPVYVIPATALCITALADATVQSQCLTVYPNPNSGSFTISAAADAVITVTDLLGKRIKELEVPANTTVTLQLSVPPGVYMLSAATAYGIWKEKVVMVR